MIAQRHDLVFIDSQSRFSIQSLHYDNDVIHKHVVDWLKNGLPCVYARQTSDETVNLGLPLFFDNKKYRVSLTIDKVDVVRQQSLPKLVDMEDFFIRCYGVRGLHKLPEDIAVYGSFLYHYLSDQRVVDEASDLDLLINYSPQYSIAILKELICLLNSTFNRAIDGELRFKKIGDIAIKELLNLSANKLLCKTRDKVHLISRDELYASYPLL